MHYREKSELSIYNPDYYIQMIDYFLKYLASVAILKKSVNYCALSSKIYLKLKMNNFQFLEKYLPVRTMKV